VQSLNEHKLATSPETVGPMAKLFSVIFPGSPAVNAILATFYISGPPSMCLRFPTIAARDPVC
jgi:zinc transporter 7